MNYENVKSLLVNEYGFDEEIADGFIKQLRAKEAKDYIENVFGDSISDELKAELSVSILDQKDDDWEDWCINMELDYEATGMLNRVS